MRIVIIPILSCITHKLLNRNLLYTGVTRAIDMCIIIGSISVFNNALKYIANDRNTGLHIMLQDIFEEDWNNNDK